jgi:hypothetical protein
LSATGKLGVLPYNNSENSNLQRSKNSAEIVMVKGMMR